MKYTEGRKGGFDPGPNKILWATDYPHPDGFFPGAPAMIANRPERSEETKRGVLAGGAKAFYGLQ
jgi:predicted TIM-barrel fold metal-dependent hydrolase